MSIKTKMQSLIEAANAETGKGDTDLTTAVQSLISESGAAATFTPSVSADGTLSWTNNKGLTNPEPVNIRGPAGADGAAGASGADGKSAYQYAVEGGYTGTETEFAEKLAQEQLTGTTDEITPTQVYDAVSAGIPVKVQYTNSTYGLFSFTAFNVSESMNVIVSEMIAYANGVYMLCELFGDKSSNAWGFNVTTLAELSDIPDIPATLPNPSSLIFTGAVTGSYDGSTVKTVNIPSAVTDDHINSLIDTKLGVIENGSY